MFKYGEDRASSTGYVVGHGWVCTLGTGMCLSMERIGQAPLGMWLVFGGYVLVGMWLVFVQVWRG